MYEAGFNKAGTQINYCDILSLFRTELVCFSVCRWSHSEAPRQSTKSLSSKYQYKWTANKKEGHILKYNHAVTNILI